MHLTDIPSLLHAHWLRLRPLCDGITLHIDAPASKSLLACRESQMKRKFPRELRDFLASVSGELIFSYTLRDELTQKTPADFPFSGDLSLGGYQPLILQSTWTLLQAGWEGWKGSFENPSDHLCGPKVAQLNLKHQELFPIAESVLGNIIAITDTGDPTSKVIYFDHEGGSFDGTILAPSFTQFMGAWCALACPDFDRLQPFCSRSDGCLATTTEAAIQWRTLLALP